MSTYFKERYFLTKFDLIVTQATYFMSTDTKCFGWKLVPYPTMITSSVFSAESLVDSFNVVINGDQGQVSGSN